ncbi:SMI1/KNR4 family protein [Roseimaritima ulvae]|uniref:Knr4/Smi1-like domain-containing protein n=2 Tax=Pirellulaceae TaxID=2691357 RepID=A0A5B9QQI0_9BACT|nr:SMI1/KNR4 family protein [Roseimaritima ulvae]QEG40172.1 hypothetical protein UC8_21780 [Roseimaritima ulvae]QEG40173.1 hypothetical protein UC8_21790 [Roseimaritima ulvae]
MIINDNWFSDRHPGVTSEQVSAINAMLQAPLSSSELTDLAKLHAKVPGGTPANEWQIAVRNLPDSYVDLLRVSHGGCLTHGEREIAFFEDRSLREYLLHYEFPVYMPGSLPFGLNGGGVFYIFDMREPARNGEFPILVAHSSCLGYDDATLIAKDIHELLCDTTNVEHLM